jgi:hypothetical protein
MFDIKRRDRQRGGALINRVVEARSIFSHGAHAPGLFIRRAARVCDPLEAERREFQSGTGSCLATKEPPRSPNQPCHHTLLAFRL